MANVLIVFAHPKAECFNRAVLDRVASTLTKEGHEVRVADLYAEGFQPALTPDDFAQYEDTDMRADVRAEQDRVDWCDALVFVFPLWWGSLPAILKGWIDRVVTYGWAWDDLSDPTTGKLRGRKVLVLSTAGASDSEMKKLGYDTAVQRQLGTGTLELCGITEIKVRMFPDLHEGTPKHVSTGYLQEVEDLALGFLPP